MNPWLIIVAIVAYVLMQNGVIHLGGESGGVGAIDLQQILTYAPWAFVAVTCLMPDLRTKIFAWVDSILKPAPKV
jgi:hypothetical protein